MTASPSRKGLQTLDRTALTLMAILAVAIALILLKGDRTAPFVRDFSWNNRQVGSEDTAFIMTFSRPMNPESVEKNVQIQPPLPGKMSWAGRRMAYTLQQPVPYGETFTVNLKGARDRLTAATEQRALSQPFTGRFTSRDSAFVYLGVAGEEEGRLVLQNLTRDQQLILTPKNLTVMEFEPYPEGDRILFAAIERNAESRSPVEQKLYTVSTGIVLRESPTNPGEKPQKKVDPQPAGTITEILDNKDYQNLKFDLAPNGQFLIVQRVNRKNLGDLGLWRLNKGETTPKRIETDPGGDFLITPDSGAIAMSQGQGMAIIPMESGAETLDFLPKFGVVLNFSKDGSEAAMVKFNRNPDNPSQSVFTVSNQGNESERLTVEGSIITAQFDPMKKTLYAVVSKRLSQGETYQEDPYLVSINLKTGQVTELLKLARQRDIQMSLAPDGLGVLFDQAQAEKQDVKPSQPAPSSPAKPSQAVKGKTDKPVDLQNSSGKAIATSRLWFLPTGVDEKGNTIPSEAQELGISGLHPRWLP
jgi:hypothetical protein